MLLQLGDTENEQQQQHAGSAAAAAAAAAAWTNRACSQCWLAASPEQAGMFFPHIRTYLFHDERNHSLICLAEILGHLFRNPGFHFVLDR